MDSGQEDDRGSRGSDESEIRRWRESEGLEPLSFEQLRELKHQGFTVPPPPVAGSAPDSPAAAEQRLEASVAGGGREAGEGWDPELGTPQPAAPAPEMAHQRERRGSCDSSSSASSSSGSEMLVPRERTAESEKKRQQMFVAAKNRESGFESSGARADDPLAALAAAADKQNAAVLEKVGGLEGILAIEAQQQARAAAAKGGVAGWQDTRDLSRASREKAEVASLSEGYRIDRNMGSGGSSRRARSTRSGESMLAQEFPLMSRFGASDGVDSHPRKMVLAACAEGNLTDMKDHLDTWKGDGRLWKSHNAEFLQVVCRRGHDACVEALLEMRANTEAVDEHGLTPLAIAAHNGSCYSLFLARASSSHATGVARRARGRREAAAETRREYRG